MTRSAAAGRRQRPDEDPSELEARAVLEAELDCTLVRIPAFTGPEIVDYRTPRGDKGIEVKQLTGETFLHMGDAFGREETLVEEPRLTGLWAALVQRPDLSTLLPRAPATWCSSAPVDQHGSRASRPISWIT